MAPSLRQLEYVVALADTGRFVEAAKRCAVSQPALSKQIREVEDLLGVLLFERARPRVIVTAAGAEVVSRARVILSLSRDLVDAAAATTGSRRGTISLGVIPTIAPYGLPGLLSRFRARFPDATLAIHELQTEVLVERLQEGSIDLGLLAHPFDGDGLSGFDVVFEPFTLIAPSGHPLDSRGPVTVPDLAGQSLLLMDDGHCLRDQALEVCALAGLPPATSVAAGSVSTLVRMVESGLGGTLLPASAIASELRSGQGLVARGFEEPSPGRTVTLQWRSTSPHREWFDEIGEMFQDHYLELDTDHELISGPTPRIVPAP